MSLTEPALAPRRIYTVRELQTWSDAARAVGERVALVPTMGALHAGHLSLVELARARAERVVVSVFVNPTQFGPNEDLDAYPRDLDGDIAKLAALGVDVVFCPDTDEMYPDGPPTWVEVEDLTTGLCGRDRPGHFRGVTTVVTRLFHAAKPHVAVFGEKDYQQLAVVRAMTRALRFDIEIVGGPIVREADGLAMSSRNAYLSPEARQQATCLIDALRGAQAAVADGERDAGALREGARKRIEREPLARVQYIEVCDPVSLQAVERLDADAVMALAVRFDATRLIDNILLELEVS